MRGVVREGGRQGGGNERKKVTYCGALNWGAINRI